LAIPDAVTGHVARCRRCQVRRERIAADTRTAGRYIAGPQLVPNVDAAWSRLQGAIGEPETEVFADRNDELQPRRRINLAVPRRAPRLGPVSLRAGILVGGAAAVVAGTTAAATMTTVFAPDHVAPIAVDRGDVLAIADLVGLNGTQSLGSFATPTGTLTTSFGTIQWSSAGAAQTYATAAQAQAAAGIAVGLPSHLPAGVQGTARYIVQPQVTMTVTFDSAAGALSGSSVVLEAGPAVLAAYGSTSEGNHLPALGVLTMVRPTASSADATLSQVEAFLLSRPDVPPQLAEEIRLLGDLRTTLPVPTPTGTNARSVQVHGFQGVLVADASGAASGVIWEDGAGLVHLVGGVIDSQDALAVADQIG
jgi:hypothetical protein